MIGSAIIPIAKKIAQQNSSMFVLKELGLRFVKRAISLFMQNTVHTSPLHQPHKTLLRVLNHYTGIMEIHIFLKIISAKKSLIFTL